MNHIVHHEWEEINGQLPFYFGEFRLYSKQLRVLAYIGPFLNSSIEEFNARDLFLKHPVGIDAIHIPSVPTTHKWKRISFSDGIIIYVPATFPRYVISLKSTFEEYLAKNFNAKRRHNLLATVRKFAQLSEGLIDFREYATPNAMTEFHRLARQISELTYQERLLVVGIPDDPNFVSHLKLLAQNGTLRGYILFSNAIPVAFAYCSLHETMVTYEKTGFDPAYAQWSPGIVLLYHILKKLFSENVFTTFDFGTGEALYKSLFSTSAVSCADIYFFRRRCTTFPLLLAHSTLIYSSSLIVAILNILGLKRRLKMFFRKTYRTTPIGHTTAH